MASPNKLKVSLASELAPASAHELIAVCAFTDAGELMTTDESLRPAVAGLLRDGDFQGKEGDSLIVYAQTPGGTRRLLLVGLGSCADFEVNGLRRAAATAARAARGAGMSRLSFAAPSLLNMRRAARAVAEGAHLGAYENDFYQSREEEEGTALEEFVIVSADAGGGARATLESELEGARVVCESVNWARALADEPGGNLPPREFARRVAEMAAEFGLRVETLGAEEIRARGMGGLWGVGQGSDEPPALIVVRYEPEDFSGAATAIKTTGAFGSEELFAFVGKGITFDTGGISIKPAQGMEEMKSDMAGGAAVLGALRAVAQLRPSRRVVGIVPAAENMPSGKAIKPGDVVRTYAGYTIEVVDTDAEGRLVLVDGIAYARSLGATRIIDLATLTGSIIVALGDHRAGLFSNEDGWARHVAEAAERVGEPVWRMPVGDDYKKKIESDIADFKNYGGRPDATGAALLLSRFAADTPWAHLDIAATAWLEEPTAYAPAGATGTGVRTLVELVCG